MVENQLSRQITEPIKGGGQNLVTCGSTSDTRLNLLPPTETATTQSRDSEIAERSPGRGKRNCKEDEDYIDKISTTLRKKAKTTLKGMGNITKAESWSDLELMRYNALSYDVGLSLMHHAPSRYNLGIQEQMREVFLLEGDYRGIDRPLVDTEDDNIGVPVNIEQDMSSVVRLFSGYVKDLVSIFVAVTTERLQTSKTHSRGEISLARQWNITLEAEKGKSRASIRFVVEQILFGKECRRRLE